MENIFNNKKIKKKTKQGKANELKVVVDHREKNSLVISELKSLGFEIQIKQLPVADYIIKNIAIERKTISDFISSMINKRLSRQIQELRQYDKKLLIIEGSDEQELYNDDPEGVHGNAIRGFLLHILLESKIPLVFTKDYKDTGKFLYVLAKKKIQNHVSLVAKKKARNKKEQMQYILEGFPGIGPATAKKLLKNYKTIKNIINSDADGLKEIIGKKAEIFEILEKKY